MRVIDADFTADRFLVKVALPDGTVIRLLADTGGGYLVDSALVSSLEVVTGADGIEGVRIPLDPPMPDGLEVAVLHQPVAGADGILSAWWFPGKVWQFDYRQGQLRIVDETVTGGLELGFASNQDGELAAPFPALTATVDDQSLHSLLDTGATTELSRQGRAILGDPAIRASSFIVASVFDQWRMKHPDWQVIEGASVIGDSPLIQVPRVSIGDTAVGPVWFERRPDSAFHDWMSQWMDRRVDGALGASAFHERVLTIDYPNARASLS